MKEIKDSFRRFAARAAQAFGSPWAFGCAVLVVLAWAAAGPLFQYSDQWQLIINTGTTIGTFLLVFVLQNTQIRDTKALHLKLDELLRAMDGARTGLVNVDTLSDEELDRLYVELQRLGRKAGISAVADEEQRRGGIAVAPGAESVAVPSCSPDAEASARAAFGRAELVAGCDASSSRAS